MHGRNENSTLHCVHHSVSATAGSSSLGLVLLDLLGACLGRWKEASITGRQPRPANTPRTTMRPICTTHSSWSTNIVSVENSFSLAHTHRVW